MPKCTWVNCMTPAQQEMPTAPVHIELCKSHAAHARFVRDNGSQNERENMIRRAAGVDRDVWQSHRKA